MRFNTALTKPAPWPLVRTGKTKPNETMRATIRPAGINLFIPTPYLYSFPSERKKPRNYRERSSDVNLEAKCFTIGVDHFSNVQYLHLCASRHRLYSLFDSTSIRFIF